MEARSSLDNLKIGKVFYWASFIDQSVSGG